MLASYAESLGASDAFGREDAGDGMTIGIVDSALGPPPDVESRFDVAEPREYTDVDERDPTDHGTWVFGAMAPFARAASFRFYRFLGGEPKLGTDLLEPISDAAEDGVDLLNLSLGYAHRGDGGVRVRRAIREEGERRAMTVVAAAGNEEDDPDEAVSFPARFDEAVAVGGFVPWCRGDVRDAANDRRLWVDTSDRPRFPQQQGPLCNRDGCEGSGDCRNRSEEWWDGNLERANGKPDTLAPVHYPTRDGMGPFLVPGTSFGTPVVTALLATTIGDADATPDPEQIRRAVRDCSVPIADGAGKKFNARLAAARLG